MANKDFDLNAIVLNDEESNGDGIAPRSVPTTPVTITLTALTSIIAGASAITETVQNCSMSSCKGARC